MNAVNVNGSVKGMLPMLPADELSLWEAASSGDARARERLIERYLPFARVMAAKIYAGRIDHDLDFDEYLQFGTIGLIEAIDRFDPTMGNLFKTFAAHRISGAILSGIEHMSEKRTQVTTRKRMQLERRESIRPQVDSTAKDLFQQLAEVAIGLALGYVLENPTTYHNDDAIVPDRHYASLEMDQLRSRMRALVETLPERERMVIKYHYLNQISFTVIADSMGISKGRVSQLHSSALRALRVAAQAVKSCDKAW